MINVPNPMTTGRPMVLSLQRLPFGLSGREGEQFPCGSLQDADLCNRSEPNCRAWNPPDRHIEEGVASTV